MRLFGYYAFHTIKNTLKKLLKTWIAIFFAFCLIGVAVGLIAGNIAKERAAKQKTEAVATETVSDSNVEEPSFFEEQGIEKRELVELIISAIIIFFLVISLINVKTGSNVFLPADAALLFSSPMKPQAVMLFRVANKMCGNLFLTLIYLYEIPALKNGVGMSSIGAVSIFVAWFLVLAISSVIPVVLFTLTTKYEKFAKVINKIIAGFFILVGLGFAVYTTIGKSEGLLRATVNYFAGKNTYWVPFWGWLRGMCSCAMDNDLVGMFTYLGITIIAIILVLVLVWRIKADFYEESLAAAETMANAMEAAKNSALGATVQRTKERSAKLKRDGFNHGFGANVFFFKTLYNRFRFGKGGMFTKTAITYILLIALGCCVLRENTYGFIIVMAVFGVIVFLRTLGNPLSEDISKTFFVMIPEPAYDKLKWSLTGGIVNTLLDIIIPFVGASIWFKAGLEQTVIALIVIISIDFFGTTVGAFIGASVPVNSGQNLKVVVQILFIYFGMLPFAAVVVIGILFDMVSLFILVGAAVNGLLGYLFFSLTPRYLENGNR